MNSFTKIVKNIKDNLSKELPGVSAQLNMAPTLLNGEDFPLTPSQNAKQSAVLIVLFPQNGCTYTVFIKRPAYNGVHSGQVSFPGGKFEKEDIDLMATALRETHEEVGIRPQEVEVIGKLTPLFISVSNMLVHPYVAIMPQPPTIKIDNHEVEYTIHPSLNDLKNVNNQFSKTILTPGRNIVAPYIAVEGEMIWGATAMIVAELIELY